MAVLILLPTSACGAPVTADQAAAAVSHWLDLDGLPLGAEMGYQIRNVVPYDDSSGTVVYYIAYLDSTGFVVVPGDDLIEPIIAFVTGDTYDPSPDNPLGALVTSDMNARMAEVHERMAMAATLGVEFVPEERLSVAQHKWSRLLAGAEEVSGEMSLLLIDDERVAPLVQSHWSQTTVCGAEPVACYNYYTPPGPDGSSNNYWSGCVATAMAQFMYYHQHPAAPNLATPCFDIKVCGSFYECRALRGGDGSGGPYEWGLMVDDPGCVHSEAVRQAIGALIHDAGVAVNMNYCSGASAAFVEADALKSVFDYSNAKTGYNSYSNIPAYFLNKMINANLHAAYPVLLETEGPVGAHAIVCDGYGYNLSTLYHHLNMGWAGQADAWYDLPDIISPAYDTVYKCIYNVYVTGSGEIISGRVTDAAGNPISWVSVTAERYGDGTYSDPDGTDANGIFAIAKVPSGSTYTVRAAKAGYNFSSQVVSTGTSTDNTTTCGNLWQVDFVDEGESWQCSDDVPKAINDYQTTVSTLTISEGDAISDVDVKLTIYHSYDADLDVRLEHPDGTQVQLFAEVGGSGDNFVDTVLDDDCVTPIISGSAPFTGCYSPEGSLSDLAGKSCAGEWKLRVYEGVGGDGGMLQDWCLQLACGQTGTISGTVKDNAGVGIVGATVATVPGDYSTTSVQGGDYVLPSIPVGEDYSVTASMSGYNSQTQDNVIVTPGETTTVDFVLTVMLDKPILNQEPDCTPGTSNEISWTNVDPRATLYRARCATDPDFDNVVQESEWATRPPDSHTFDGLSTGDEYYYQVAVGYALCDGLWSQTSQLDFDNDTLDNVRVTELGEVVLESSGPPPIEDTVGTSGQPSTGEARGRWNAYECTESRTLIQIEVFLGISESTEIQYGVYESDSKTGTYTQIHSSTVTNSDTDPQFHSSGPISVPLEADMFYLIGAAWSGEATHHRGPAYGSVSFGECWGQDTSLYPPPPTLTGPSTSWQPYYHKLTSITGREYVSSGSIISTAIAPDPFHKWGVFTYTKGTSGEGTELTVDVLDAEGAQVLTNVGSGTDLGTTELPGASIKLRANLSTTDSDNTPSLSGWSVGHCYVYAESPWSDYERSTQMGPSSIFEAKISPDNTLVFCPSAIASAAFADFFYIEADDRSCGIRVEEPGHGLSEGTRVDVAGRVWTNENGERYIDADTVESSGTGSVVPLGMSNRSVGGADFGDPPMGQSGVTDGLGLSNIGLLVTTWGWVESVDAASSSFTLSDRSSVLNPNQPTSVSLRVIVPAGASLPAAFQYVSVTGISSCIKDNENIERTLLARRSEDIKTWSGAGLFLDELDGSTPGTPSAIGWGDGVDDQAAVFSAGDSYTRYDGGYFAGQGTVGFYVKAAGSG